MHWARITIAVLALFAAAAAARAGELRLDNGALIPGEFARLEGHMLVWRAELIGEIKVETARIASIDGVAAGDLRFGPHETLRECRVRGDATGAALDCADGQTLSASWRDLSTPEAPNTGKITASLTRERGNSYSDEYELDARATWQRERRRHEVEGSVDYEKKRSGTSEDEADIGYQLDFLRARGWYLYTKLDYMRDRFSGVQEATIGGVGLGRAFHLAEGLNFRVQAGPDLGHFDLRDYGRLDEPGGNLQWRFDWKTGLWRLEFVLFHEAEYRWLLDDADLSYLETRSGLSIPLFEGLVAELRLDYDRVGFQIPGTHNTDSEWVFALGYRW